MFSISTVASSTRMPTARASPPSVMMLIVSPIALRRMIETRIESGIEIAMTIVLRQSPRKSRIMSAVSAAAIRPPAIRHNRSAYEQRLIEERLIFSSGGRDCAACWHNALHPGDNIQRRGVPFL